MKLSLVVLSQGKAEGQSIPINLSQFLVGRDPQCQLRPASPLISKRHCAVLIKGGKVFLRDFGSTNGSFVNDEPVKTERQLKNDDILKIGPLLFRVHMEGSAPVDKPTPPPQQKTGDAGSDDESVAAMLLSLQDDGVTASADASASGEVPSGTTVMDMPALPPPESPAEQQSETGQAKPAEKKAAPPKKDSVSSSSAAAALLQKIAAGRKRP
jgi:pSer/pThr/pTyr-binding forkhead associated (FHA) protein